MEEILRDQAREINRKLPQSQHVVGPNKQDCGLLGDTMIHTLRELNIVMENCLLYL
jgi:hypothetical protein